MVRIDVVVQDKHHTPVTDLKQSDFEVFDNGARQTIRSVRLERYPASGTGAAAHGSHAGVYSNRVAFDPARPNAATAILLDIAGAYGPGMEPRDLAVARDHLVKFLRQIRPNDELGIYMATDIGFWTLQDDGQNCANLVKRLADWDGGPATGEGVWSDFAGRLASRDAKVADGALRPALFTPPAFEQRAFHVGPELLAMAAIVARHLAGAPGAKNLILVAGNVDLTGNRQQRARTIRDILRSGVAVYGIDAEAVAPDDVDTLFAIPDSMVSEFDFPEQAGVALRDDYDTKMEAFRWVQASLSSLSRDTGGQAFLSGRTVRGAIRRVLDETRVTYELTFSPSPASPGDDADFHRLRVKVARPDITVRYGEGYFGREDLHDWEERREGVLRQAAWSPLDATGIGIQGEAESGAYGRGEEIGLKLTIDPAGLCLDRVNGRWRGRLEVLFAARGYEGDELGYGLHAVRLNFTPAEYASALRTGVVFRQSLRAEPGATSLRAIVRDAATGNLGSVTIPIRRAAQ